MTIIVSVFLRGYRGKTVDFSITSQHHRTTVAYFLNHGNGTILPYKKLWKAVLLNWFIRRPVLPVSQSSALWTIRCFPISSLRHRICIQSKRRIFIIAPQRTTGLWTPGCFCYAFPAMESRWTMRSYCMIRQNQKLKSYRISPRNCRKPLWFPTFSVTAGIRQPVSWKLSGKGFYTIGALKPTESFIRWASVRKPANLHFVYGKKRSKCQPCDRW